MQRKLNRGARTCGVDKRTLTLSKLARSLVASLCATTLVTASCTGGGGGPEDPPDRDPRTELAVDGVDQQAGGDWLAELEQLRNQPISLASSAPVGTLPGGAWSDDGGAAHYAIPIDVPPGPNGHAPSLTLAYSSHAGSGLYGVGFSVGAASMVARCQKTLPKDGAFEALTMGQEDPICYGGQRLVLSSGQYGTAGSEYRLEADVSKRFTLKGDLGSSSASSWFLDTADGQTFEFLELDDQRDRWHLDNVEDPFGNTIDYEWTDFGDHEFVLSSISYGGTGTWASRRKVLFETATRPDLREGYVRGEFYRRTQRVEEIRTEGPNGDVLARYELEYAMHPESRQSVLTQVTRYDAAGVAMPPTVFEWAGQTDDPIATYGARGTVQKSHIVGFHSVPTVRRSRLLAVGNFLGDEQTNALIYDPEDEEMKFGNVPALLTAGPNILPGGWENLETDAEEFESQQPGSPLDPGWSLLNGGLHRIQQAPGLMRVKFSSDTKLDQILVPVDSEVIGDDGRDAWGVSTVNSLRVALHAGYTAGAGALDPGTHSFTYVDYPTDDPVYSIIPLEYNGDGRDDLFLCQGQGYKSSHWVVGLTSDVANDPAATFGWEFYDTGVGCSSHDEYTVLPHVRGTEVLAVIPRYETDPALMEYPDGFADAQEYQDQVAAVPESSRTGYHALDVDPSDGLWKLSVAEVLPRDLYQRWADRSCNNGLVAAHEGAPLLGAGLSRDLAIDVDGDGNRDLVRYELFGGDTASNLSAIQAETVDDADGWAYDLDCQPSPGQAGVLRVYRNTGDGFVAASNPAFTFEGSPHANLWINWYGAQLRDWNADGLLDIALPSDGDADSPDSDVEDWVILLSGGDGTFIPLDMAHANAAPDWPHYLEGDAVGPIFDEFGTTKTFAATENHPTEHWQTTQIFLRAGVYPELGYPEYWDSFQDEGARLERVTNGQGFWNEFVYDRTPRGLSVVVERTANIPTVEEAPIPVVRRWEYDYSDSVLDVYGVGVLGFSWVHEVFRDDVVGTLKGNVQTRFYNWSYDENLRAYPYSVSPFAVQSGWVSSFDEPEERWHVGCRKVEDWSVDTQTLAGGRIWQSYPSVVESFLTSQTRSGYQPYGPLYQDVQEEYRCDDYQSPDFETHSRSEQARDDYGNVVFTSHEVLAGVTEETRTTTHYEDFNYDPADWEIASPERTTVESRVGGPGGVSKTRTSIVGYRPNNRFVVEAAYREYGTAFEQSAFMGYDNRGNLSSVSVQAPGEEPRVSSTEWDAEGVTPLSVTNALGHSTNFVFHTTSGVPVAVVDANGVTQKSGYDGFFRPITSSIHSSPLGPSDGGDSTVAYQASNVAGAELDVVTQQRGQEVVISYDRVGRVVRELWHGVEPAGISDFPDTSMLQGPETCRWHEYDVYGSTLGSSEATSSCASPPTSSADWVRHEYDLGGRHLASEWFDDGVEVGTRTTHHNGDWVGFTREGSGPPDVRGHAVATTDADNRETTTVTDALGRLSATVDALGMMTCFDYGPFGELEGVHRNCRHGASGRMESSTYVYDALSRLEAGTEPARGTEVVTYTGFDEVESITDAKSQVISHEYDVLGRLRVRRSPDCVARWSFDADRVGALSYQLSEDGVKESFTYDDFGRVERTETEVPGVDVGGPWAFEFGYDGLGRLGSIEYPYAPSPGSGAPAGMFGAVFNYDGSDHLRSVSGAGRVLWALREANDAGQPQLESFNLNHAFGVQTKESGYHDFTLRPQTIDVRVGATDLQEFVYTWSPGGDLLERREETTNQFETFGYDALHRLEIENGVQTAFYDELGNFTNRVGVGDYTYEPTTGRLAWYGNASNTPEYDDNGNVESIGGVNLQWTPFDRVREMSSGGENLTFSYDIAGSRVARFENTGFTLTLGGLFEYSEDTDSTSGQTDIRARYFVPVGGAVVEVRDEAVEGIGQWDRDVLYQYNDHLGSGSVLVNEDGTVEEQVSFDAWGQARQWGAWAQSFDPALLEGLSAGYTGHQSELDLGLMNMRGRMYSPVLARFLSVDPVVEAPGDAQTWNPYSYVLNNPLRYVDPSGLAAKKKTMHDLKVGECLDSETSGNRVCKDSETGDPPSTSLPSDPIPGGNGPGGPGIGNNGGGGGKSGTGGGSSSKTNKRGEGGPETLGCHDPDPSCGNGDIAFISWDAQREEAERARQRQQDYIEESRRRARESANDGVQRCGRGEPMCSNGADVGTMVTQRSKGGKALMVASGGVAVAVVGAPVIEGVAAGIASAYHSAKLAYYYVLSGTATGSAGAMQTISFTRNTMTKLRKHSQHIRETARRLGVIIPKGPGKPETQRAMRQFFLKVVTEGNTTYGRYMTFAEAQWSRLGDAIVVRRMDGAFITFLDATKGGVANFIPGGL